MISNWVELRQRVNKRESEHYERAISPSLLPSHPPSLPLTKRPTSITTTFRAGVCACPPALPPPPPP